MTQQQAGQKVEEVFRRFGSLINFGTLLVGAVFSIMMVGSWRTTLETNDKKAIEWQVSHEAFHREKAIEIKEYRSIVNTRIADIERVLREDERKTDNIDQRLISAEKGLSMVERNANETNTALNKMSGDMQVVKEILTRIEKKQGG